MKFKFGQYSHFLHVVSNAIHWLPALDVYLVTAHVEVIALEQPGQIGVNTLDNFVCVFAGGVQLTAWRFDAVSLPRLSCQADNSILYPLPTLPDVGGCVELWNYSYASHRCESNDIQYVFFCINLGKYP